MNSNGSIAFTLNSPKQKHTNRYTFLAINNRANKIDTS